MSLVPQRPIPERFAPSQYGSLLKISDKNYQGTMLRPGLPGKMSKSSERGPRLLPGELCVLLPYSPVYLSQHEVWFVWVLCQHGWGLVVTTRLEEA